MINVLHRLLIAVIVFAGLSGAAAPDPASPASDRHHSVAASSAPPIETWSGGGLRPYGASIRISAHSGILTGTADLPGLRRVSAVVSPDDQPRGTLVVAASVPRAPPHASC